MNLRGGRPPLPGPNSAPGDGIRIKAATLTPVPTFHTAIASTSCKNCKNIFVLSMILSCALLMTMLQKLSTSNGKIAPEML